MFEKGKNVCSVKNDSFPVPVGVLYPTHLQVHSVHVFLWKFIPLFVGINLSVYSSFVAGERCTEV